MNRLFIIIITIFILLEFYFESINDQTKLSFSISLIYTTLLLFFLNSNASVRKHKVYFSSSLLLFIATPVILIFKKNFEVFFGLEYISHILFLVFQLVLIFDLEKSLIISSKRNYADGKYIIGVILISWLFFIMNFLDLEVSIIIKIIVYLFVFSLWVFKMFALKANVIYPSLVFYAVISVSLVSIFGSYALFIEKFKFEAQFIRLIHTSGVFCVIIIFNSLKVENFKSEII